MPKSRRRNSSVPRGSFFRGTNGNIFFKVGKGRAVFITNGEDDKVERLPNGWVGDPEVELLTLTDVCHILEEKE